ncbi:MAG: CPBP family intramembrane glutamic endopeptidase [bacterium]
MKNLLISFGIIIGIFLLLIITFGAIAILIPEFDLNSYNGLIFAQSIQSILLFGGAALLSIWVTERRNPLKQVDINKPIDIKQVLVITLFAVAAIPVITFFGELNALIKFPESLSALEAMLNEMAQANTLVLEKILNTSSYGRLGINLFIIAVIPAITEEIMFRGWIQRILNKSVGTHTAVWISAIIFSAIHMEFYGFIPRMIMGAGIGYLYASTGSLWSAILAHFVNNAVATIVAFISYNNLCSIDLNTLGDFNSWYIAIGGFAIALTILIRFISNSSLKKIS